MMFKLVKLGLVFLFEHLSRTFYFKLGKNVRGKGPNEKSHLFLRALYYLKIVFGLSGKEKIKKLIMNP